MNQTIELLRGLCEIDGVSGCEEQVAEFIKAYLAKQDKAIKFKTDCRGNLICTKKGKKTPKNKIMLSSHMDEVGFIITYIEESGLLRFSAVGAIDTRVVVGKPVRLENGICGVVGAKPIHLQTAEEQSEPLKMDKLYIDIGASSREEAEKDVSLGDRAVFRSDFLALGSHKIKAKAIDNRAGCAVLISLLQKDLDYDITVAFTTQSEAGGGCAGNAAFEIAPEIAIVVETSCAADVPGVDANEQISELGAGPCLTFKDAGTLYDMELTRLALKAGEKKEIPCQPKRGTQGTSEGKAIQGAGCGTRVVSVTVPCRYIHSGSCVADKRDILSTLDLLLEVISQFGGYEIKAGKAA